MSTSNFLIGPIKDGIRKDQKPWANPEDSFTTLINAIQFRGRIQKRQGYKKLGRLTNGTPVMGLRTQEGFNIGLQNLIAFDTTLAYQWNGSTFVLLPSVMPVTWSGTDSQFFYSINYANSLWVTNSNPGLNGYLVTLFAGAAGAGPFTVNVTAPGNTFQIGDQIYFLNITGAAAANNLRTATVTAAGATFTVSSPIGGAFTNGVAISGLALSSTRAVTGQDGIRYYGVLSNGTGWANYNPPVDPNNALAGSLLMFAYRGYLVFLNTTEGNDQGTFNFPNRARWTQIGTPYYSSPTPSFPNVFTSDPKAARDDLFGRGGANDAPTNESIVGAAFIRDILVVYFERSTWRLRFVNNAQNPFVWERVNIELGSDCTFSTIPFDKGIMAIGTRGIVFSDGNDTIRFDEKIPDQIFNIKQSNNGLQRVQGIRTFKTKLNYWSIPSSTAPNGIYPNQVLVFNYDTKNWSYFDDSFTCFGYYYTTGTGYTWGDLPDAWSSYTNISWDSGISESGFENIVAGNQQGYVLILEQTAGKNDPSLSISAIAGSTFTSNNHNLSDETWITLSGITGTTSSDGVSLNGRNFQVNNPGLLANTFSLSEFKPLDGGLAVGATYTYTIAYKNIVAGSIQINVGALVFVDRDADGILYTSPTALGGTIDYNTGLINLSFSPSIISTLVIIRCVTYDPSQNISSISTTGAYTGEGEIAIISNINVTSKIFNFFNDNKRARLSKVDFYVDSTSHGQFTCNVFGDSSDDPINTPLPDNPLSNIVETTTNPYQIGQGEETIFRLYAEANAQTIQIELTMSDQQLATNVINSADIQILAMSFSLRRAGRLI